MKIISHNNIIGPIHLYRTIAETINNKISMEYSYHKTLSS